MQLYRESIIVIVVIKLAPGYKIKVLERKSGKPLREYAFWIYVDAQLVKIRKFLSFGEIKHQMRQFIDVGSSTSTTAKFPSGSYLGMKNYTSNKSNALQRANDLVNFLTALLEIQAIGKKVLHTALFLNSEWHARCVNVFLAIAASKRVRVSAYNVQQHAQKQAVIAQCQVDNRQYAQTLNQIICTNTSTTALLTPQISTITFNHAQQFTLTNRAWSGGNAYHQRSRGFTLV